MLNTGLHPPVQKNMRTALFTNFSDKPFTGYWNGKGKTFEPGASLYMQDFLAKHFAKHLTNRELLKTPGGETMTSPKKPEDVPMYMEIFNKAYSPDDVDDIAEEKGKEDIDSLIGVANKNRQKRIEVTRATREVPVLPDVIANPRKNVMGPDENEILGISNQLTEANKGQDPTQPQVVLPPDFDQDEE